MEQLEQPRSNTKFRGYFLTINNFEEKDEEEVKKCPQYVYQIERGSENTEHLQGVIFFKNPRYFNGIKQLFPRAHIERVKNKKKAEEYCSKIDTRVRGPYSNYIQFPKDYLMNKELYNWQKDILDLIKNDPDERKIHWYWDIEGAKGKTTLARHICLNNKDAIYIGGKAADMKYAIAKNMEKNVCTRICILDLARTQENFISYTGIEEIKNGIFFSNKYESGMIITDIPHVIIFANYEPDRTALSMDRWDITEI